MGSRDDAEALAEGQRAARSVIPEWDRATTAEALAVGQRAARSVIPEWGSRDDAEALAAGQRALGGNGCARLDR